MTRSGIRRHPGLEVIPGLPVEVGDSARCCGQGQDRRPRHQGIGRSAELRPRSGEVGGGHSPTQKSELTVSTIEALQVEPRHLILQILRSDDQFNNGGP